MGRYSAAIREAGVLLRSQATGVAIGPPLTVERAHLDEIATAVRAGLDAVAAPSCRTQYWPETVEGVRASRESWGC